MFGLSTLATLLLAASSVRAHATFQDLWINGVDQAGSCVRTPPSNSPVTSVSSNDLTCNVNGATPAAGTCTVNAGDHLAAEMHQQPGDRSCSEEAIGGDHWGPTLIYMAKVDSVTTTTPWTANWFKVNNTGLITANPQYWGTMNMNDDCGKVYFQVPTDIAPGNYLIRAEVIALHVASSVGGAQFYMSCYQITVAGSGSASPATVKFPGAYSATDPGILINIHTTLTGYTIPGPPVYEAGSGSSPAPSSSKSSSSSSSSVTSKSATSTVTSASPTSTCSAAKYAQCGGQGFSGCTVCASGSTCTSSNQYYSQCL